MALDMDAIQRRRLLALAKWHDEWVAKHDIDDADWVADGCSGPNRRSPSAAAEQEYHARANQIMAGTDLSTQD
jgi:hypothetical protein